MKNSMIQSLNKKADYSMLDRLNEQVSKKVDTEILRSSQQQLKQEIQQQIEINQEDIQHGIQMKDTKIFERIEKCEINGERALDELYQNKDQLRSLSEQRKSDIEETADFVKQLFDGFKDDTLRELHHHRGELDKFKRDLVDKGTVQEMLSIKQNLLSQLDLKVDLKEVQGALNDCQNDLAQQLKDFKANVQSKLEQAELNATRLIERKADHKDLKNLIDKKLDKTEAFDCFIYKQEYESLRNKT